MRAACDREIDKAYYPARLSLRRSNTSPLYRQSHTRSPPSTHGSEYRPLMLAVTYMWPPPSPVVFPCHLRSQSTDRHQQKPPLPFLPSQLPVPWASSTRFAGAPKGGTGHTLVTGTYFGTSFVIILTVAGTVRLLLFIAMLLYCCYYTYVLWYIIVVLPPVSRSVGAVCWVVFISHFLKCIISFIFYFDRVLCLRLSRHQLKY